MFRGLRRVRVAIGPVSVTVTGMFAVHFNPFPGWNHLLRLPADVVPAVTLPVTVTAHPRPILHHPHSRCPTADRATSRQVRLGDDVDFCGRCWDRTPASWCRDWPDRASALLGDWLIDAAVLLDTATAVRAATLAGRPQLTHLDRVDAAAAQLDDFTARLTRLLPADTALVDAVTATFAQHLSTVRSLVAEALRGSELHRAVLIARVEQVVATAKPSVPETAAGTQLTDADEQRNRLQPRSRDRHRDRERWWLFAWADRRVAVDRPLTRHDCRDLAADTPKELAGTWHRWRVGPVVAAVERWEAELQRRTVDDLADVDVLLATEMHPHRYHVLSGVPQQARRVHLAATPLAVSDHMACYRLPRVLADTLTTPASGSVYAATFPRLLTSAEAELAVSLADPDPSSSLRDADVLLDVITSLT